MRAPASGAAASEPTSAEPTPGEPTPAEHGGQVPAADDPQTALTDIGSRYHRVAR